MNYDSSTYMSLLCVGHIDRVDFNVSLSTIWAMSEHLISCFTKWIWIGMSIVVQKCWRIGLRLAADSLSDRLIDWVSEWSIISLVAWLSRHFSIFDILILPCTSMFPSPFGHTVVRRINAPCPEAEYEPVSWSDLNDIHSVDPWIP